MKTLVIIVHGVGDNLNGNQFMDSIQQNIEKYIDKSKYHFLKINWSSITQNQQNQIMDKNKKLRWKFLRKFVVNYVGDALEYQISMKDRTCYDEIHSLINNEIKECITKKIIDENSPICFIGYSLGSIIVNNYIYNLQNHDRKDILSDERAEFMSFNELPPILKGETIKAFYSVGSPLAIWLSRHQNFGDPIKIDEWLNFYDPDDIIAYPLKNLNDKYDMAVKEDIKIKCTGLLFSWNPLSHMKYDKCPLVYKRIASSLSSQKI